MFIKTALLTLAASSITFALPSSAPARRESPTTWQVSNYELTNDTGNGWTYTFQISGEAPDGGKIFSFPNLLLSSAAAKTLVAV